MTTKVPKTSSTFRRSCDEVSLLVSATHHFIRADGSVVEVGTTDRDDGDFHIDAEPVALESRRADVMPGRWAVVRQVHGTSVADASSIRAGAALAPEADAIITDLVDQPIAVQGADCAPIAFITDRGPIAVAHAGWRGLINGVVRSVVEELAARGARVERAIIGPVIGPECYEFGAADLVEVETRLGSDVRGVTSSGSPALDMRAAITKSFADAGVDDVQFVAGCTACANSGFSHRARKETQRHAVVARIVGATT
ncbi:MAG: YfiH family protein [Verrucomicrobiales bacterium]|jgi:YfiH family protein